VVGKLGGGEVLELAEEAEEVGKEEEAVGPGIVIFSEICACVIKD
jgi:hypothetical protein